MGYQTLHAFQLTLIFNEIIVSEAPAEDQLIFLENMTAEVSCFKDL